MSLINDALKKAQRQRTETPYGASGPPMPGGGHVTKRGAPMQTQTIMLIVAACVVLVVLSVVGTVYLLNGKSSPPKTAAITPATPKVDSGPKIDIPLPPIIVPAVVEKPEVKPTAVETKPEVKPAPPPAVVKTEEPKPEEPVVKPAATPPGKSLPLDERVHVFLDALKVTGIRAGADSRVLMNEHVYRTNDIVDRSLGLRLTKVAADSLTFTDANGVVYVKNF